MTHDPSRFSANVPTCLDCKFRNVNVCGKDSVPLHLHCDSGYCPVGLLPVAGDKPDGWEGLAVEAGKPSATTQAPPPDAWGPPLWRELHAWAASADLSTATEYLDVFALRVPCGSCREHWRAIVAADPPDFSSNAALARSVWRWHNAVNVSLAKPVYPLLPSLGYPP